MSATHARALIPGFVLHRRAWSETSLILELFTEEDGRVGVVARGARRSSARGRPPLQPLQRMLFSWGGRGELANLSAWEAAGHPAALAGNRLVSALYVNELLVRLLERSDPHPELWEPYQTALQDLSGEQPADLVLRAFELRLLSSIGYGVELRHEAESGAPLDPGASYHYDPERGPLHGTAQGAYSGAALLALGNGRLATREQRTEARRLMRTLIDRCLGGQPLNSRKLFRKSAGQA